MRIVGFADGMCASLALTAVCLSAQFGCRDVALKMVLPRASGAFSLASNP